MRRLVVIFAALALGGCPIRVDPPSPAVCPTRPTCATCATDPNCGWLPTDDGTRRRCYDATGSAEELVRSPEGCPDGALSDRAPTSAP